jgi:hypothetical protein
MCFSRIDLARAGAGCVLMGFLNDLMGGFNINFILYASLAVLSLLIFMCCIPNQTKEEVRPISCVFDVHAHVNGPLTLCEARGFCEGWTVRRKKATTCPFEICGPLLPRGK